MKHICLTLLLLLWGGMVATMTAQQNDLHVVLLGDSNTWYGGDSCNVARGWNCHFRELLQPASIRSYARSGATWVHTSKMKRNTEENTAVLSDDNVITNQIYRLIDAVDAGEQPTPTLILAMAGTNDMWWRPELLPTLADTLMADCRMLQKIFPLARLVLLTPFQTTKVEPAAIRQTADIIIDCGRRLGIEVVRTDSDACISRAQELRRKTYTRDGVHTNEAGARRIGKFVFHSLHL